MVPDRCPQAAYLRNTGKFVPATDHKRARVLLVARIELAKYRDVIPAFRILNAGYGVVFSQRRTSKIPIADTRLEIFVY